MAQIANIAINDGAATPVLHTFIPVSSSGGAMYREQIPTLALVGQGTITVTSKYDAVLNKVRAVLAIPVLEAPTSAGNTSGYTAPPRVAYTIKANIDFILPSRSTVAQRNDARRLALNMLNDPQLIDAINNLAQPY